MQARMEGKGKRKIKDTITGLDDERKLQQVEGERRKT